MGGLIRIKSTRQCGILSLMALDAMSKQLSGSGVGFGRLPKPFNPKVSPSCGWHLQVHRPAWQWLMAHRVWGLLSRGDTPESGQPSGAGCRDTQATAAHTGKHKCECRALDTVPRQLHCFWVTDRRPVALQLHLLLGEKFLMCWSPAQYAHLTSWGHPRQYVLPVDFGSLRDATALPPASESF